MLRLPSAQFFRFAATGTMGFAVDTALLLVFSQVFGLSPYIARLLSFAVALLCTFSANRFWTFAHKSGAPTIGGLLSEFGSYAAVQVTGGAANYLAFVIVIALIGRGPAELVAASAAGSIVGLFVNYFGAKALVFGKSRAVERAQAWTRRAAWIAVGAGILLLPAVANHGPMINFDSEQYFSVGKSIVSEIAGVAGAAPDEAQAPEPKTREAPAAAPGAEEARAEEASAWISSFAGARSPFYAVFLYVLTAAGGLWTLSWVQALISAWVVSLAVAELADGFSVRRYLTVMAGLSGLSTLSFFAAWPMPDLFAGLFLLSAILILLGRRLNRIEAAGLLVLMAVAASFHSTVQVLAAASAVAGFAALLLLDRRMGRAAVFAGLVLATVIPGIVGGRIYSTASERMTGLSIYSPPFLTARVIGDGPGQAFLDRECRLSPEAFEVCRFSGRSFTDHNDFLWGVGGDVPAYQASSPEIQKRLSEEQARFVIAVASAYPKEQLAASARNAARELVNISMRREYVSIDELKDAWPGADMLRLAPQTELCRADSRYCDDPVWLDAWMGLVKAAFFGALALTLAHAALTLRRGPLRPDDPDARLAAAGGIFLVGFIANGVVCGVLSGVHARYQARLEWILPALAIAAWPLLAGMFTARARALRPRHSG